MSSGAAADRAGLPDVVTARPTPRSWGAEARAAISLLTRLPVRAPADGRTGSGTFAIVGAGLGAVASRLE